MTERGPNLSHWPGNRTPGKWKADLSTGIALRFARATAAERREFLGDARTVVNDHYDTDGFGSLLVVLQPDVALPREELLLSACAAGDFGTWQTWRGFAIDRIVAHLASAASPVHAVFAGIRDQDELALQRYRWLLDHAAAVLDHPERFEPLWRAELAIVEREIEDGLRGGLGRQRFDALGLAVVTSHGPRHRTTLNTLAGAFRILHVEEGPGGPRFRYHDRTESWFELVTFHPLPRRDLRPLARRLGELEPEHDGARWNADPPSEPIPELWFGVPGAQPYGQFTRELRPSRLDPAAVIAELRAFFAAAVDE